MYLFSGEFFFLKKFDWVYGVLKQLLINKMLFNKIQFSGILKYGSSAWLQP